MRAVLALAILVVGLSAVQAAWIPVASSEPPIEQQRPANDSEGGNPTPKSGPEIPGTQSAEDRIADYTWWLTAATIALGAATVVLAIGTGFLVIDGRRHSRHALRAYLGVHETKLVIAPDNSSITINLKIQNTGQTPAVQVRMAGGSALEALPFKDEWTKNPDELGSNGTINPGGYGYINVLMSKAIAEDFVADDVRKAIAGEIGFWVHGRVTYRDAFHREQWFRFRYRLKKTGTLEPTLSACDTGNESSEN